jgi:Flp pilus assembly protein TadG
MSSMARRRAFGERGTAIVEMAFVVPLFFLLIFGMMDFGWAFSIRENMIHSAQEGLRSALVANSADQVCTAKFVAHQRMQGIIGATRAGAESSMTAPCTDPASDLVVTITPGPACAGAGTNCLTVTMTYPYRSDQLVAIPLFENLAPSTMTVSVTQRVS